MAMLSRIWVFAAALIAFSSPAAQAQTVRTIGVGDPARAPLLDALRIVIARDLGQPVKFLVDDMRVQGDWAFIVAHPQTPAGGKIDFSKTRYAEQLEMGVLDGDILYALLKRVGGKWTVVTFMIGPTDVGWMDWQYMHKTPVGLIPQPGG